MSKKLFSGQCRFKKKYAGCLGAEVEYWTTNPEGTAFKAVTPTLFLTSVPFVSASLWEPGTSVPIVPEGRLKPELPIQQIEAVTNICRTPAEIEKDLMASRCELEELGRRFAFALDTYPTPRFPFKTSVYPKPRYFAIKQTVSEERLRAGWITGLHGHFGCSNMTQAIRVLNGLRPLIPMFVALSARSPEYMGLRDGYMSERLRRYMEIQPEIVPPHIESIAHLDELARARGFDDDPGRCWWGVRINAKGTVELRLMDMQETPAHAAQLIALFSTACRWILHPHYNGHRLLSAEEIKAKIDMAARSGPSDQAAHNRLHFYTGVATGLNLKSEQEYLEQLRDRLYGPPDPTVVAALNDRF